LVTSPRRCLLGQTEASAAPINSAKARVSLPSYTRVGSYPGRYSSAIVTAEAAASSTVVTASPTSGPGRLRLQRSPVNSSQGQII